MGNPKASSANSCNQKDKLAVEFEQIELNERRTLVVVALTAAMMVIEIIAGYATGSMALLADGYHMASHAGALGIAFLVYRLTRSTTIKERLTFGTGKLLPLGGYSSAIGLGIIAIWMAVESIHRIFNPVSIEFNDAIAIAIVGLGVNLVSAWILGAKQHHHDHDDDHQGHDHGHVHDHNHRSAVAHVLADALTSLTAIVALTIGKYYSANWLDPAVGVLGSLVILRWAYVLCRDTAWELLDGHAKSVSIAEVKANVEEPNHKVLDLHLWKVGPANFACQLIVESNELRGAEYFRNKLQDQLGAIHVVVEERLPS